MVSCSQVSYKCGVDKHGNDYSKVNRWDVGRDVQGEALTLGNEFAYTVDSQNESVSWNTFVNSLERALGYYMLQKAAMNDSNNEVSKYKSSEKTNQIGIIESNETARFDEAQQTARKAITQ